MTQRGTRWFGHAFAQLDIASHGDSFRSTLNVMGPIVHAGRVNQPVLLGLDAGLGYWLVPPCQCGTGLAVVGEVHYSVPLGSEDSFTAAGPLTSVSINTPAAAAYEVLNFTAGLQFSLGNDWTIRPGAVLPAREERVFDVEYFLQVNRSY